MGESRNNGASGLRGGGPRWPELVQGREGSATRWRWDYGIRVVVASVENETLWSDESREEVRCFKLPKIDFSIGRSEKCRSC